MNHKKAFTLIELLVVIAIIALLMGILMPALHRVREQARESACRGNVRSIGQTLIMYLQENDYRFPDFHTHTNNCNGHIWFKPDGRTYMKASENRSYWGVIFKDYIKETEVFGCPSFKNFSQQVATEMLYTTGEIRNAAFSMNGWMSKEKSAAMRRHSEVIVVHDHMEPRIENGNDMLFAQNGTNLSHYRTGGRRNWYRGIFRHATKVNKDDETGGRLNCLWLDGHVSSIRETLGLEIPKRYYDPLGKN